MSLSRGKVAGGHEDEWAVCLFPPWYSGHLVVKVKLAIVPTRELNPSTLGLGSFHGEDIETLLHPPPHPSPAQQEEEVLVTWP